MAGYLLNIIQRRSTNVNWWCPNLRSAAVSKTSRSNLDMQRRSKISRVPLRGIDYAKKGELDRAISDYSEAIRLDPTHSNAFFNRGLSFGKKQEWDKAISDYTKAIKLAPKDAKIYYSRGLIFEADGNWEKAISDYGSALRLNSDFADAQNAFAWLLATCPDATKRNGVQAVVAANKACELTGWRDWRTIDTLAAAYAELGDFARAVDQEKWAISCEGVTMKDQEDMQKRLKLYEQRRSYHEPSPLRHPGGERAEP